MFYGHFCARGRLNGPSTQGKQSDMVIVHLVLQPPLPKNTHDQGRFC